jgi:hypothetical protein
MGALLVVESLFGNTWQIGEAAAEGLSTRIPTETVGIADAPDHFGQDVDLLVVGGPTHAFGLTRPGTRRSAAETPHTTVANVEVGLREWLEALPWGELLAAATFDTKIAKRGIPGSAARAAARRLRRLGYRVIVPPETFRVQGTEGPLVEGELERARRWGEALANRVAAPNQDRAEPDGRG